MRHQMIGLLLVIAPALMAITAAIDPAESDISSVSVDRVASMGNETLEIVEELVNLNRTDLAVYQITYTIGGRKPNDRQVYRFSDSLFWSQLQDVNLSLKYSGARVTYIQIVVYQTSTSGQAYITNGGIGYNHFALVVRALRTSKLEYVALVFGI